MSKPIQLLLAVTVLLLAFVSSCTIEPTEKEVISTSGLDQYPLADERLWEYFSSFEDQAAKRGINLNLNQLEITGEINNIPETNVAGLCQYGRHVHHVTIDAQFWNRADPLTREMVVYHELGHCVLGIGHRESDNNSGICLSIMNSGTTDCRVLYNQNNKPYYLDELFSEDD